MSNWDDTYLTLERTLAWLRAEMEKVKRRRARGDTNWCQQARELQARAISLQREAQKILL